MNQIILTKGQIEILNAFKGLTDEFEISDEGKVYAIVDDVRIELKGISKEPLPSIFDN